MYFKPNVQGALLLEFTLILLFSLNPHLLEKKNLTLSEDPENLIAFLVSS
jgi:hypothetical protein